MSPKLHRRTPSSAHTYRLLIFKELQNSLAFALLSLTCKSFCLQQQRSGIMRLFVNFVKHFVLTFFTSLRCRIALFVSSTEAELCGVLRFSSSTALTFFAFRFVDRSFCPSTAEPEIMKRFQLFVNYLFQDFWQLSFWLAGPKPSIPAAFPRA